MNFIVTRPEILLKIGCKSLFTMGGGETQNRTGDTRIFSPLLYRLSYFAEPMVKTKLNFKSKVCLRVNRERVEQLIFHSFILRSRCNLSDGRSMEGVICLVILFENIRKK